MSAEDWTDERVEKLTVLWTQGLSCSQIAREVSKLPGVTMTRNAVIGKRMRLGLPDRCSPNRTYGPRAKMAKPVAQRPRAIAAPTAPRQIVKPEPREKLRTPTKGITAVRFVDRSLSQCAMFCEGEDGALGYVCGAPAVRGAWCASCVRLAYQPNSALVRAA